MPRTPTADELALDIRQRLAVLEAESAALKEALVALEGGGVEAEPQERQRPAGAGLVAPGG